MSNVIQVARKFLWPKNLLRKLFHFFHVCLLHHWCSITVGRIAGGQVGVRSQEPALIHPDLYIFSGVVPSPFGHNLIYYLCPPYHKISLHTVPSNKIIEKMLIFLTPCHLFQLITSYLKAWKHSKCKFAFIMDLSILYALFSAFRKMFSNPK